MAVPAMSFVFHEFPDWSGAANGGGSQFCSCENLSLPQRPAGPKFSVLNLKDLQGGAPGRPLIPEPQFGTYGNLWNFVIPK